MRRHLVAGGAALIASACADTPDVARVPEPPETRAAMAEIVAALRVALPLSLSEARFAAPESREEMRAALAALRRNAALLEVHGRSRDAGFAYLSRTLALDAEEIERRFEAGRLEEARFLLGQVTEDCVGCHSRLAASSGTELGGELFRDADSEELTHAERIRLEVATRQFDRALSRYEALLRSEATSATELDLQEFVSGYLLVSIRVTQDPERARATLEAFAARADVPPYLALLLEQWIHALSTLRPVPPDGEALARARAMIAEGQALRRFPMDRAGLVHDLFASSLLHDFVTLHPAPSGQTAEAYYLLGLTELHAEPSTWRSGAEIYLETAIRMAPGSPWARSAYAVLEEETLAGHTGSAGLHLPPEVSAWLAELRALADVGGP